MDNLANFLALEKWLEIIDKYDKSFLFEKISNYKSRQIHQKASQNKYNTFPEINELLLSTNTDMSISDDNIDLFTKESANIHMIDIELNSIIEDYMNNKFNNKNKIEVLSEKLGSFFLEDDDEDSFEFFK